MNTLLNMIYAIRVKLDDSDDFVGSRHLEGHSELNKDSTITALLNW